MCGIAGLVRPRQQMDVNANQAVARAMADRLQHRGPNGEGTWGQDNVALAHRRLSIVDLSQAGQQPMVSQDGRWVITYNGEIYNAQEIRSRLQFRRWRGNSDTEVLLEAIAESGMAATVDQLVGMFAFAAFDTIKRELWLCRDRLGIKPLYYGWAQGTFAFASDLHALRACHEQLTINPAAVATFLRHSFIPGPCSIFNEVKKLVPGTLLRIETSKGPEQESIPSAYWKIRDHIEIDPGINEDSAQSQLHALLRQSVKDRLIADVPLGGFLSGGYDSSLICALMQEQRDNPVNTFTIGFDDPRYNEAEHAKNVAAHLGTNHTELYVNEQDMLASVARLPQLCDEPFADPSILPTFLVSQLASKDVTVVLSGDGGDELFWGYPRYAVADKLWNKIKRVPGPLRSTFSDLLVHPLTQTMSRRIPGGALGGREAPLSQKLRTAAELLGNDGHRMLYEGLMSHWRPPADACIEDKELLTPYNDAAHWTLTLPSTQRMALQDTVAYLPDDILTKVDRASMAVSLEARVPLLDHRVVEFVSHLPGHLRQRPDRPKYLLKKILNQYVPTDLTDRPKMGFGAPLETWLRGPLREWANHLLDPRRMAEEGLLNPEPVSRLWQDHLTGKANNAARLWDVMMLEAWLEQAGTRYNG